MLLVSSGGAIENSVASCARDCRQNRRRRKGEVVSRSMVPLLEGWRDMLAVVRLTPCAAQELRIGLTVICNPSVSR